MRRNLVLAVLIAHVAILAFMVAGCDEDVGDLGLRAVLAQIIGPAVTSGWDYIVAAMRHTGLYNEATGKFELGQDDVITWLMALVPAAQSANRHVALDRANEARALKAAKLRGVRPPAVPAAAQ